MPLLSRSSPNGGIRSVGQRLWGRIDGLLNLDDDRLPEAPRATGLRARVKPNLNAEDIVRLKTVGQVNGRRAICSEFNRTRSVIESHCDQLRHSMQLNTDAMSGSEAGRTIESTLKDSGPGDIAKHRFPIGRQMHDLRFSRRTRRRQQPDGPRPFQFDRMRVQLTSNFLRLTSSRHHAA